jgi:hypothetical protein
LLGREGKIVIPMSEALRAADNYNSFQMVIFRHQGKVTVWTGTHGILTYPDVNGNDVAIYLWVDGDKKYIPAPMYYWKVWVA